jgi:ribonucleoside-diphosphate reductase alpha chain
VNFRHRLPNRRESIAFNVNHRGMRYRAHVGFHGGDRLGEVFLDAAKPDSAVDAFAADAAILISLLLQHGSTVREIGHALRRSPSGVPASLIGEVVDQLIALDDECSPGGAE